LGEESIDLPLTGKGGGRERRNTSISLELLFRTYKNPVGLDPAPLLGGEGRKDGNWHPSSEKDLSKLVIKGSEPKYWTSVCRRGGARLQGGRLVGSENFRVRKVIAKNTRIPKA